MSMMDLKSCLCFINFIQSELMLPRSKVN
uniref:Uncharacterized protein n=1 Tax=Arundo donax TaxID=35708 RepID=A0A0A8YCA3_ARUDO